MQMHSVKTVYATVTADSHLQPVAALCENCHTYHFWQEPLLIHVLGGDVLAHGTSRAFQHAQAIINGAFTQLQALLLCMTRETSVKRRAMQTWVRSYCL